jgi:hypothetical protein
MRFGDLKGGDMFISSQSTGDNFPLTCYMKLQEGPDYFSPEKGLVNHPFTAVCLSDGALLRVENSAKVAKIKK